jgi:integrase
MAKRSKGDGLKQLPPRKGRKWWKARFYWVDPLTGKEREGEATFQADTRLLALQMRDQRLEEAKRGTPTGKAAKKERNRFGESGDAWLSTITTESSRTSYGSHLRALKAAFGDWWLDAVETRHLQDHLDAMRRSASHVNSRRDVMDHIFKHAIRRGWAVKNPVRDTHRRSTRLEGLTELGEEPKRALTEDEAARHIRDVRQHDPEAYPLILLQFHLGCRFGEVSALRHEDVDLEAGIVRIRRGQYKGVKGPTKGRYARIAGIPLELRAIIARHVERVRREGYAGADELVFPRPPFGRKKHSNHWSSSTLHHVIERSYKRLGLRGEGVERPVRGTTHVARHTVATIAEELASASVLQKVLGQTTEVHRRYKHPTDAKVIELGERVAERLKANGPKKGM